MHSVKTLLNLACGQDVLTEPDNRAERLQLVIAGLLASLLFACLWGAAVGSSSLDLALGNLYKLPMIVLLSAVSAVPAGMLAWKLIGARYRATDLLLSYAAGVFSATLVLAVMAPLAALYYHSSGWAGPVLGIGTVFLSLLVGTLIFIRNVTGRTQKSTSRFSVILPVGVFLFMQVATLVQLIALASPILPELTVFDGGIDRLVAQ